ncbi:uncharacterized protein si:ch73-103b9.2 [Kryptolebias marmoratus]|uniref:uncharacterized protein si:ch73-103b9.2 n=1 Tax=Kryptolebias marmoratus TaxID=37003 RepID=UPI0007F8C549|nr:uncharacterized protein si:ch73-103b9.2 [Kryptolebias marmoratus]XP_037835751.1 uncharacterized protein si:ch73-103b9.2 [Kryptolebias marmoratus]
MLSQRAGDEAAENREGRELSSQENTAAPKETPRRHIDALLDISEENFMKELEAYEYQGYSGWEDDVWGWTRAAPLSCLLVTQKNHGKPKQKEVENPTPLCVDSIDPKADSSASFTEQQRESHVGPSNCKKSVSANEQIDSWGPREWPALNAMQGDVTHFLLKEKTEEGPFKITPLRPCHLSSQYSMPESRHAKPQRHSHKPTNKVVPIKNFTFLPPIQPPPISPKVSCHVCRGKKAPDEENLFMLRRKSAAGWAGVDTVANSDLSIYSAALTSKYHTYQHNPHLFFPLSVSLLKKNELLMSPAPDPVHPTSYSMGRSISQAVVRPPLPPRCLF